MRKFLLGTVAAMLAVSSSANAQIVFNNSVRSDFQTNRGAGDSPLAAISVGATKTIDQIGVMWDPAFSGNLKFVIFDLDANNLLFSTAAQSFSDVGTAFYLSTVFSPFQLNVGTVYGIGAIADVSGLWNTNNTSSGNAFTQNGITASDDLNGNVANYASPSLGGDGSAMIILQLGSSTTTVPEPSTGVLLAAGLAGIVVVGNRRRHRA